MNNQILETNQNRRKIIKILKAQIILSLLGFITVCIYLKSNQNKNLNDESFSKIISQTSTLSSIYNAEKASNSNIFGSIEIPKLGINYAVFNEFNEELLKLSPCKFYGAQLNEAGNIAIAGHNYDNHTFFSDLNKLKIEDEIYIYSTENIKYTYSVYDLFETSDNNLDCLQSNFLGSKELTLLTCNNSNKKRFVVKAILKN